MTQEFLVAIFLILIQTVLTDLKSKHQVEFFFLLLILLFLFKDISFNPAKIFSLKDRFVDLVRRKI